jgi:hypothetical protein
MHVSDASLTPLDLCRSWAILSVRKKRENSILLPYGFQRACNIHLQEVNPFYIRQAVIKLSKA